MTIKLKYAQTKHDLLELAKNDPDKVYKAPDTEFGQRCVYFTEDGAPSCIVGRVLNKHGVQRQDLFIENAWRKDFNYTTSAQELSEFGLIDVDEKTESLLLNVQNFQDTEVPWGDAVRDAIQFVEKRYG